MTKTNKSILISFLALAFVIGFLIFFVNEFDFLTKNQKIAKLEAIRKDTVSSIHEEQMIEWKNVINEIENEEICSIFYRENNSEVPFGYKMTEGTTFASSSGSYIIANAYGGKIWLIDALVDSGMRINILTAIAFITNEEWEKATLEAKKIGLRFPSPRVFRPNDFVQLQGDRLTFHGSHFSKYEK